MANSSVIIRRGPPALNPPFIRTGPVGPPVVRPPASARGWRALRGLGAVTASITPSGARVSSDTTATTYPDGTLIAATGTAPIYVIMNGQLRWIPNWATYVAMGFNPASSGSRPLAVNYVPAAVLNSIPRGADLPDLSTGSAATAPPGGNVPPTPAPQPSSITVNLPPPATSPIPTITGVVATTLQAGAVWDASINGYVNPDGSVYYSTTAGTISTNTVVPASTGVVSATMQTGAVWDATIGGYVNPDGSVYYAPSTTSSIDFTSPSTWPVWMWAVAAGAAWFVFLKKK